MSEIAHSISDIDCGAELLFWASRHRMPLAQGQHPFNNFRGKQFGKGFASPLAGEEDVVFERRGGIGIGQGRSRDFLVAHLPICSEKAFESRKLFRSVDNNCRAVFLVAFHAPLLSTVRFVLRCYMTHGGRIHGKMAHGKMDAA